jgi:hypothetical protein
MSTQAEPNVKETELRPEVFDEYDAFLKQAIRDYYDRGWKSRRGNFIALVIASGQMGSMAADSIRDGSGFKKAALGAAGVVALRLGLRYALSGPLGVILTGAAAVSAVGYLVKHQKEITGKVGAYRKLIAGTRERFEETQGRLSRRPLRRRQPQPDGRRALEAVPGRDRRRRVIGGGRAWPPEGGPARAASAT